LEPIGALSCKCRSYCTRGACGGSQCSNSYLPLAPSGVAVTSVGTRGEPSAQTSLGRKKSMGAQSVNSRSLSQALAGSHLATGVGRGIQARRAPCSSHTNARARTWPWTQRGCLATTCVPRAAGNVSSAQWLCLRETLRIRHRALWGWLHLQIIG